MFTPGFLIICLLIRCCVGEFIQTLIGDNIKFESSEKCRKARTGLLVHLLSDGTTHDVAMLVNGLWTPDSLYKSQLSPGEETVVLKDAAFNDNGVYELSCNLLSRAVIVQVEVLVPFELSVGEGQSARLPCHFATAGKSAESVQWERESQLVFKQLFKTGEVYGKDFKGRANGSQDAYRRGDMSLTLTGIQPRDQGNYFCKILLRGGVPENGQPGAVRLWVNHSHSASEVQHCPHWIWIVVTVICTSLLVIGFVSGWFGHKASNSNGQQGLNDNQWLPSQDNLLPKVADSRTFRDIKNENDIELEMKLSSNNSFN